LLRFHLLLLHLPFLNSLPYLILLPLKKKIIPLYLLPYLLPLILLSLILLTTSQNFEITKGDFSLKVTGNQNVPKFDFWRNTDTSRVFSVKLQHLFEVRKYGTDYSKEPGSEVSLSSLTWSFSKVVEENNVTKFNITCVDGKKVRWSNLLFRNKIRLNCNDSGCGVELKFDVVLENYVYSTEENGKDNEVKVALVYMFHSNAKEEKYSDSSDEIRVNGAYFRFVNYALLNESEPDGGRIAVNSIRQGNNIWLIYDHFSKSFYHDPSFGTLTDNSWVGWVIGISIVVVLGGLVVLFLVLKKKKYIKF
jgi:hypothetical protein